MKQQQPTRAQLDAARAAARKAIEDYSQFDSAMVPDAALRTVVNQALIAALNVPTPHPPPTTSKGNTS